MGSIAYAASSHLVHSEDAAKSTLRCLAVIRMQITKVTEALKVREPKVGEMRKMVEKKKGRKIVR